MIRAIFGEDSEWLAVMALLALAEFGWWLTAWSLGIAPLPFIGTYLLLASSGLAIAVVGRFAFHMYPIEPTWAALAAGTLLVAVGASVFLPLKYAIPREIPFWLDQPLTTGENAAFGTQPWLLADRLLGWATKPLDWLYGCWLPTQLLVMNFVMLSRPSRAKSHALIAYGLAWFLLGAVAAVLLSSAGPLFYDRAFGGTEFAQLAASLHSHGAWFTLTESDLMWSSIGSRRPGLIAGISAMPSIHVAISLWIVLSSRMMIPRLTYVATSYFILVFVGSVLLGWHYFSDGLVGAIGMWGVWWLAGIIIEHLSARRPMSLPSFPSSRHSGAPDALNG